MTQGARAVGGPAPGLLPAITHLDQGRPAPPGRTVRSPSQPFHPGRGLERQPSHSRAQQRLGKRDRAAEERPGEVRRGAARLGATVLPAQYELPFKVARKAKLNPRTMELRLAPLGQRLAFVPGQYVLLSDPDGTIEPRSYSIANCPRPDGILTLLVTHVPGGQCSSWVGGVLVVGAEVVVDGPFGNFFPGPQDVEAAVYLAGGVGLAPVLALLEEALGSSGSAALHLLCSFRSEEEFLGRDQVQKWQHRHPRFHFTRTLTRSSGEPPLGRLPSLLPALLGSLAQVSTFAAGPEGFVDSCSDTVLSLGADPSRLHTEVFFPTPSPWEPTPP